jgi:histidinol-phosphate aminotransferase
VPERSLVIYDEAYIEFAANNARFPDSMSYRYDNVITLRTFSKAYGLAGLRIGYGFAHKDLIANVMKVKLPFEPSILAQVAGQAALGDHDFLERTLAGTNEGRAMLQNGLEEAGFEVLQGNTNFLAVKTSSDEVCRKLSEGLLQQGVIIRSLAGFGFPELFRVTIGTDEENRVFLEALGIIGF